MKKWMCALLALMLLCCGALAEGQLNVTGTGSVSVTADQVDVTLGVSLTGEDVAETQREVNARVNAICAALRETGLDALSISTNSIYIYPQYDYSGETQRLTGYSISSSLRISTGDIDRIGEYIDAAFAAGANTFDSIVFSAQDTAEAKRQALALAVQNAMDKAAVMAEAAGRELNEIKCISEGDANNYMMEDNAGDLRLFAATETAATGTDIHAAQIIVTANVQMTYAMN